MDSQTRDGSANASLTHEIAQGLLEPSQKTMFGSAEQRCMWSRRWILRSHPGLRRPESGGVIDQLWDAVLLRTYDGYSGSQPNHERRMFARSPRMRLDSEESREKTLTIHGNYKEREATPYISFGNSPEALQDLAEFRRTRPYRADQYLVVVDPRTRFELGLPILHFKDEMTNYKIPNPYPNADYYTNHFLCLWEVTPEEVVGIWRWDELRDNSNWYDEMILPAVASYREQRENAKQLVTLFQQHNLSNKAEEVNSSGKDPDTTPKSEKEVETERDENDDTGVEREDLKDNDRNQDGEYDGWVPSDWDEEEEDGNCSDSNSCSSESSYERVLNENWSGQTEKMFEDFGLY